MSDNSEELLPLLGKFLSTLSKALIEWGIEYGVTAAFVYYCFPLSGRPEFKEMQEKQKELEDKRHEERETKGNYQQAKGVGILVGSN
jgi:hypothetical protein